MRYRARPLRSSSAEGGLDAREHDGAIGTHERAGKRCVTGDGPATVRHGRRMSVGSLSVFRRGAVLGRVQGRLRRRAGATVLKAAAADASIGRVLRAAPAGDWRLREARGEAEKGDAEDRTTTSGAAGAPAGGCEDRGLHDRDLARQLRRAATSVALNTSEGSGNSGGTRRERYRSALGSARETGACIDAAVALGYVEEVDAGLLDRLDHVRAVLVKNVG